MQGLARGGFDLGVVDDNPQHRRGVVAAPVAEHLAVRHHDDAVGLDLVVAQIDGDAGSTGATATLGLHLGQQAIVVTLGKGLMPSHSRIPIQHIQLLGLGGVGDLDHLGEDAADG